MSNLRLVVTSIALLGVSALMGASLYDAVVLAPNLRGGPTGLEHGRLFMANATPANLFRILSPVTQCLLLVTLVANWASRQCRWLLLGALLALVLCDVITFTYHYPRLHVMFTAPLTVEPVRLLAAAQQWAAANLIRVALLLGTWLANLVALMRLVLEGHRGPSA
jgi:hypothetical protein